MILDTNALSAWLDGDRALEIGQACIVLAVVPLLAFLCRRSAVVEERVLTVSSFCVM